MSAHCLHLLQQDEDALIKAISSISSSSSGFDSQRPLVALIIFKSLQHWHSFEAERTSIFDRIINVREDSSVGRHCYISFLLMHESTTGAT